ncbi:MAG: hypothetical protein KME47_24265 [Nodosilinea sp. WJT8-NPBG4]|jgi:hypothetical protein|nr:hypothetical protein [Nodosilinea sp. WJT8-NPBG4]
MARKKRSSVALEKAQRRIAGMQSVTRAADFGNGYTMESYEAHIQTMQEKLMTYNRMLSMVDGAYNDMLMAERKLMDFSTTCSPALASATAKTALNTKWPEAAANLTAKSALAAPLIL